MTPTLKTLLLIVWLVPLGAQQTEPSFRPNIPRAWEKDALTSLELPPPVAGLRRIQVSPDDYYKLPLRQVLKSYPVYHPGKEPAGYLDWLKQQEPEPAFKAETLRTEADWLQAGEIMFDSPLASGSPITDVRDPDWYKELGVPVAKDGTVPFMRYVVTKRGEVTLGLMGCAMCHSRVLPDGTVVKGAQGNFPFERNLAYTWRKSLTLIQIRRYLDDIFRVPWLDEADSTSVLNALGKDEIVAIHAAVPPGALFRQDTGALSPVQVPDLIGVRDRRYLDHTGLQNHRSIGDLMRYAALNTGLGRLVRHRIDGTESPRGSARRYTDEQLYALALFAYSLQAPPNPNQFNTQSARGRKVFEREGCAACHTPPLYTNNRLVPVEGFKVPHESQKEVAILNVVVGTDPTLTLRTNRGTGYYKVPSLKGLWYRGLLEHSGSVASLEDWFDAARLQAGYVPTGFKGYGVKTRAIKGHEFGLKLSAGEKKDLIAFLKTL